MDAPPNPPNGDGDQSNNNNTPPKPPKIAWTQELDLYTLQTMVAMSPKPNWEELATAMGPEYEGKHKAIEQRYTKVISKSRIINDTVQKWAGPDQVAAITIKTEGGDIPTKAGGGKKRAAAGSTNATPAKKSKAGGAGTAGRGGKTKGCGAKKNRSIEGINEDGGEARDLGDGVDKINGKGPKEESDDEGPPNFDFGNAAGEAVPA
ncbi:uncharacterized protein LTR77_005699 [Saxophila tyrrhenica]|uniref:Myb-like domain-containing protein n=1 Tax=Saxophila tyrrhenica TaxID=1690608 RepID=A0AAV9P9G7_9PEZI|nr:hypothetical protein LTR77_005699 [Saxophila tyrrhenica]